MQAIVGGLLNMNMYSIFSYARFCNFIHFAGLFNNWMTFGGVGGLIMAEVAVLYYFKSKFDAHFSLINEACLMLVTQGRAIGFILRFLSIYIHVCYIFD